MTEGWMEGKGADMEVGRGRGGKAGRRQESEQTHADSGNLSIAERAEYRRGGSGAGRTVECRGL